MVLDKGIGTRVQEVMVAGVTAKVEALAVGRHTGALGAVVRLEVVAPLGAMVQVGSHTTTTRIKTKERGRGIPSGDGLVARRALDPLVVLGDLAVEVSYGMMNGLVLRLRGSKE